MQFNWRSKEVRMVQKNKRKKEWHRWFAWKPVKVATIRDPGDYGTERMAFLEFVWRKRDTYSASTYEYMSQQEYFKQQLKGSAKDL